MKIIVTNSKGQSINSDISIPTGAEAENKTTYAKKILSFAEIALGQTA